MAKSKTRHETKKSEPAEQDSVYFLKLVVCLILGSLWLKVSKDVEFQFPIPVGLLIGLALVQHEHFRIDRKIEYALLLVAAFIGFWLPIGLFINL